MRSVKMDERDLSELSYLAHALVRAPDRYEEVIRLAGIPQRSRELDRAIAALVKGFRETPAPRSLARLRATAQRLFDGEERPAKDAARALSWALENRGVAGVTDGSARRR